MSASWHTHQFSVEMPHMVPGGKLGEVEFLKLLNAHQWRAIATLLGRHLQDIVSDAGERLYPSLLNVEISMGPRHSFLRFGEGTEVHIRNRINVDSLGVTKLFEFVEEHWGVVVPEAAIVGRLNTLKALAKFIDS